MFKNLIFKKIVTILSLISFTLIFYYPVFAIDENIIKPPLEIVPSEWEKIDGENFKVTPYMVPGYIQNEVESNNAVSSADGLGLNAGRKGKIGSSTDVDYYFFTPTISGKYRFDLVNIPMASGIDYELAIYDSTQTLKGISTTKEEYETIVVTLMENTKYYIKVYGFNESYSIDSEYYITVTNDKCALLGYKYPFRNVGAPSKITANYGYYPDGTVHYGLDLSASIGTNLYSVGPGTVFSSGWATTGGNYVTIKMNSDYSLPGETTVVTYVHMQNATTLNRNDTVTPNTLVGKSGNTGTPPGGGTYGAHLHLQINNNGTAFAQTLNGTNNPLRYFTSYKFTGLSEDLTEYNDSSRSQLNTNVLSNSMYIIDEAFIRIVGRDNFIEWVNSIEKTNKNWTIIDFFNHFDISNTTIKMIINADENLSTIYNIDEIITNRNK
ncbi:MAG TPA: hypothetical protein DC000_02570 [Clostridiales bacterium]|nr:hypothetical protein [Clostridiales bacterium]